MFGSVSLQPMLRGPAVAWDREGAVAGDTGPLSLDDGVNLLTAGDVDDEPDTSDEDADPDLEPDEEDADAGDPPAETDEDEASDQEADGDDAPDEDDPASEEDPDEDAEDEPAEPAIAAPQFWSAEEKAVFAKAPADVQLLVVAKDQAAEKRVYEAKEEAAQARKDASVISQMKEIVDQQVRNAEEIFRGKWDGVDWAAWAKEDPQEAFTAKIEFDEEQKALEQLRTAQAATEAEEHRTFLRNENAALRDAGHVLADPAKGRDERARLVSYAETAGYSRDDLKWAGAKELTTLHKAMLYDELQAKVKADPPKPTPKPKPAPTPPKAIVKPGAVKPGAAPPPRKQTMQRQRAETVQKAMRTGRMDDAVAAVLAIEGKG